MADEKKNALAELAEQLNNGYVSLVVNGRQVATFATAAFPELEKVQRIVAELAKIEWRNMSGQYLPVINNGFVESLIRCRAIAEENFDK